MCKWSCFIANVAIHVIVHVGFNIFYPPLNDIDLFDAIPKCSELKLTSLITRAN